MWLQTRFERVVEFAQAAWDIGFEGIELSHILPETWFEGLTPGRWDVAAVHHPCPLPDTRVPYLSDPDPQRRRVAVSAAKTSVDTAVHYGASAVVLHVGDIPELEYREDELRSRTQARQQGTAEYNTAMERFKTARASAKERYLAACLASLGELAEYAGERGIRLGLETRELAREIPNIDDMDMLLAELPATVAGLWLDTGHVAVTTRLGFANQREWLRRHGHRLIGLHLHDCLMLRDHLIPGLGDVNFAELVPYLAPDTVRTCEFDWFYTPEEVREGVSCLVQAGVCTPLRADRAC